MVTPLYAGILGLFYIVLSFFVIRGRFKHKIEVGDKGSDDLFRRIRVHGNFIEYVPVALILILLAEQEGAPEKLIHALGIALVFGRVMHAVGFYHRSGISIGRSGGMVITFLVILMASLYCIQSYFIF